MIFKDWLVKHNFNPDIYLKVVRYNCKLEGYNPDCVHFCNDGVHKLEYRYHDKVVPFGAVDYNDFILWTWREFRGEVEDGYAEKKREAYRSRATRIKGSWKSDPTSPNNLAIHILW